MTISNDAESDVQNRKGKTERKTLLEIFIQSDPYLNRIILDVILHFWQRDLYI